ncbi:hypothetical protein [Ralstonia pseudosolanacearum]|uniref:hypothetical protein n=1 Tax=Ralstonia pseudosolanacearum TaxID=1310165 RepID=UPI003CE97C97
MTERLVLAEIDLDKTGAHHPQIVNHSEGSRGGGMKIVSLFAVLLLVVSAGVSADPASNKRLEACRSKLKQAQKLDVLYDLDWKPPSEPKVVVGPTFFQIGIDAKEGFAKTVNCFLMAGESGKYVNFDVLSWQTGKTVGRYSYDRFEMK